MNAARADERRRLAAAYDRAGVGARRRQRWHAPNRGNAAISDERRVVLTTLLRRSGVDGLAGMRIVELGCGRGDGMKMLAALGAGARGLLGVDVLPDRLAEAQGRVDSPLVNADGRELAVRTGSVDVVSALTVFSSIGTTAARIDVAGEIDRVLRPGGRVLWYDLRTPSPANRDVRPVRRRDIHTFFPGYSVRARSVTLVAPLARLAPAVYPVLARVPMLRTHLVAVLTKPSGDERIHA